MIKRFLSGFRSRPDLLLGAGALALGAALAVVATFGGKIPASALWGGLATSALASVPRAALALASFLGAGYTVLGLLAPAAYARLGRLECGFLAWIIGLLVASQCFWVVGWVGVFHPPVLMALQLVGALLLVVNIVRGLPGQSDPGPSSLWEQVPRLLALALIGSVAGLYLVRTLGTRLVHPDALDYHLGLPMWYLRSGGIVHFPTLWTSGRYLGVDLLYAAVLTPAEPLVIVPAKLLSLCFGGTAFVGVFLLARRLGATHAWGLVAVLGLMTVPALARWGLAKNDLATAGMALSALWLLTVAFEQKEPRWSLWIGLCLGYAVTVKPTVLAAAPALGTAVAWRFGLRPALWFAVGCLGPVIPWAFTTWSFRDVPFPHFVVHRPDYVEALKAARSDNGLILTPGSFVENAVPLLLDSDGRVSGNDSLGVPFLVAGLLGLLGSFRKGAAAAVYGAGALFLLAGMLVAFEGRFLNRYFLLAPAVAFPVACAWLSSLRRAPWSAALPIVSAVALVGAYATGPSIFRGLAARPRAASIQQGGGTPKDAMARQLALTRRVEESLTDGEVLLMNDGMIYFISVPFLNAHALQSDFFRYDRLDAAGLARQLRDEKVGAALVRSRISGTQPQLLEVVERYGRPIGSDRRLLLDGYRLDWVEEADPGTGPTEGP